MWFVYGTLEYVADIIILCAIAILLCEVWGMMGNRGK